MLLIEYTREFFQLLAAARTYAEVGVYKGDFAMGVKRFAPRKMYLIDPWVEPALEDLIPADYTVDPRASIKESLRDYYPGGMSAALEQAFLKVQENFGSDPNCEIIRNTSKEAVSSFSDGSIDLLYLDGNHRYDYVLADLERWAQKVSQGGVIIMNDCYVAHPGKKQHMSVLEALSTFLKLYDWVPIAMVNQTWTDVAIARRNESPPIIEQITGMLIINNISFTELPNHLIHAAHHRTVSLEVDGKQFTREVLSFD